MAGNKYLQRDPVSGEDQEVRAVQVSAGAGDSGKIPALDNTGRLSETMMPPGIGAPVKAVNAAENLTAGDIVYIADDGGSDGVFRAHAGPGGHRAVGYVLDSFTNGEVATVYMEAINSSLSGLVSGSTYFLSETPGQITATPVTTAGAISQVVGVAISSTELSFEPGKVTRLAA